MATLELTCIVIVSVLSNICYSILVPFLPIEFKQYDVHVSIYGYIFAMYALAVMVGSPIVGKALTIYGRKIILILGVLFMGVSMIGFGLINYLDSKNLLITAAISLRTFQGLSSGLIQTTSYAIVAILFPDNQQKYLGILEAAMGFGLITGPVIGSSLYTAVGFHGTFYCVGSIFICSAVVLYFVVPKSVDKSDEEMQHLTSNNYSEEVHSPGPSGGKHVQPVNPRITYTELLCQRVFVCTAIAAFFSYVAYSYQEPVLAVRLMDFDLSPFWIGIFFSINAVSYVISSLVISWFTYYFKNRTLIVVGMFAAGLSQFLIGPSPFLPDNVYIMAVGQLTLGGCIIFFLITSLPEMINDVVSIHPHQKLEASDISSGVFNSMLGCGQMISPLYGSYVTDQIGFRWCADTIGYFLISYSFIYFVLCIGVEMFQKKEIENIREKRVKEKTANSVMDAFSMRSPGQMSPDRGSQMFASQISNLND